MKKTSLLLLIVFSITSAYAVDNELILEEKFPKKLSDFHFFKDTHAQIPSKGVLPYELISSLFSDYSYKQRKLLPIKLKIQSFCCYPFIIPR